MAGHTYVISRSTENDRYRLWRFDPKQPEILTPIPVRSDAEFDRTHRLVSIGNYLLEWGPLQMTDYLPSYPYRLFEFDPTSRDGEAIDPLAMHRALQKGAWTKKKFWGYREDFGNPKGRGRQFADADDLTLIPLGSFLLNLIPTPGRGTFQLWNFDPSPGAPGKADPLPAPYTPMGAFETIQQGSELFPIGNTVLDWTPATGEFKLWSFDPQAEIPLSKPALRQGSWASKAIDASHRLVVIGDYLLDWVPSNLDFRLWKFDPDAPDPLGDAPVVSGVLPGVLSQDTQLLGVETQIPVNAELATTPGTIDFMRSKIKHIVYYMLENRSFDHVCGWLYEQGEEGVRVIGPPGPYRGASTDYYNLFQVDGKRQKVHLSKYQAGKLSTEYNLDFFPDDPYHDNSDVLRQLFFEDLEGYRNRSVPNMGGFVWNNGTPAVMMTYTPTQLPVLNGLAKNFAISDEWFCSMPGPTDVNRAFALTGSALGMLNNFQNGAEYRDWPNSPRRPSIWKVLWSNGITDWKIYNSVEWLEFVHTYHLFLQGQIPSVDANPSAFLANIEQFKADAKAGNLPRFSFLEPIWISLAGTSSYHPGGDLIPGERALNEIYDALRSGPNWDETLLVISFDEHGGIYDHVPPPQAENPWPNDRLDGFGYDLLGPRIPTILVSPWISQNTIFRSETKVAYDLTSILATVLKWCGIPESKWGLGARTQHAPTFEGVFLETRARRDSPSFTPPYDQDFPPNGGPGRPPRLHDLHRLMAPRLIQALIGNRYSPAEAEKLCQAILSEATDLGSLVQRIKALTPRSR